MIKKKIGKHYIITSPKIGTILTYQAINMYVSLYAPYGYDFKGDGVWGCDKIITGFDDKGVRVSNSNDNDWWGYYRLEDVVKAYRFDKDN